MVNPKKVSKGDDNYESKLEEQTPTATRHLILIRHGQYNTNGDTDKERILTELGILLDYSMVLLNPQMCAVHVYICTFLLFGLAKIWYVRPLGCLKFTSGPSLLFTLHPRDPYILKWL